MFGEELPTYPVNHWNQIRKNVNALGCRLIGVVMKNQKAGSKNNLNTPMILALSLIILISLACNAPMMAKQAKPVGFVETSVAQTMIARNAGQDQGDAGQDDQADQGDQAGDQEPTATFTPEVTETPTNTPTITDTPTPEVAMVYSSANTNCRTGPDTAWPAIFTMYEGDSAEAIARGTVGDYWYINIPDQPGNTCAMWGKYATPSGPYELLPEWTPMPTPTPQGMDFTISYYQLQCSGPYFVMYRIDNVGSKTLESWQSSAVDHTGGSSPQTNTLDHFVTINPACTWFDNHQDDLTPGEAYYVPMVFNNNPNNHKITTTIKICTEEGLGGKCKSKTITHKP
jgi:hypothetical protein